MSETVIKVSNLSKSYLIHHQQKERYTALRDVMANSVKRFGRRLLSAFGLRYAKVAMHFALCITIHRLMNTVIKTYKLKISNMVL